MRNMVANSLAPVQREVSYDIDNSSSMLRAVLYQLESIQATQQQMQAQHQAQARNKNSKSLRKMSIIGRNKMSCDVADVTAAAASLKACDEQDDDAV